MEMEKDEISLLLYLETRAVDFCGRIAVEKINDVDRKIMTMWNRSGFVQSGRIIVKDCTEQGSMWCRLSPEAYSKAADLRMDRAERGWEKKRYMTTEEKKGESK